MGVGDQTRPNLTGIKETLETISVSEDYIDMPLDIATRGLESAELPQHRELCQKGIEKLRAAGAVSRYAQ